MYPDFQFLIQEWFGIDIPWLSLLKTFGFLVALSFMAAAYTLYLELKRNEELGLIPYKIEEITVGKKYTALDYILAAILSFVIGFKFIGLFADREISSPDPLGYIFSTKGHLLAGVVISIGFTALKYFQNKKESADGEKTKKVKTWPHMRVGDMAVFGAITGFGGAKLFNTFENWDRFMVDPFGSLFSSMGLTFYGGLIVATVGFYFYAKRLNIDFRRLADAAAPGLILAYGIGRLGCMVAGDGDWGIYNEAFKLDENQKVVAANKGEFDQLVASQPQYFEDLLSKQDKVPRAYFKQNWLPVWFQAYSYPNNVAQEGMRMKDCNGSYCRQLVSPVFPTPLYEFLASVIIFLILWAMRRKWKVPLTMFSVYMIFNGIERFFIEKIRVNFKYKNFDITQAELIALGIILGGIILFVVRKKIDAWVTAKSSTDN